MATLIRIKRPLASEPAESIVVKPKRQRTEEDEAGGGEEDATTLPTGVLQRVATVNCKEETLEPDLLSEIRARRRTGEELRRFYKRPSVRDIYSREVLKRQVQVRATQGRQKLHARSRGNIEDVKDKDERVAKGKEEGKRTLAPEGQEDKAKEKAETSAVKSRLDPEDIKYYDVELEWPKYKDGITCNGVPMESEKFVYDIYYSPAAVDWTEFICEVERYEHPFNSSDELSDDEDDENDENNWRNEYPEDEDDNPIEDEDGYMDRMMEYRSKQYNMDVSFDADEYDDEDDFDEDGNLLQYGQTNKLNPLRLHLARLNMSSEEGGDEDSDVGDDI